MLNRCPTLAVKNVTPEEAWSGVKPTVEHLRVFGCLAHVHVPDAKRTKLENKSFSCVLLRVSDESKAYRLYDPILKRIIISGDVVFEEDKQWNWDASYEEHLLMDLEWGDETHPNIAEGEETISESNSQAEEVVDDETLMAVNASPGIADGEAINAGRRRNRQLPLWMKEYVSGEGLSEEENEVNMALVVSRDPVSFEEAVKSSKWRTAMNSEINSIEKNQTWKLTDLPPGAKKIVVKWIFKTKFNELGEVDKYKAHLVAKGYSQQHGVDYTKVFAPVARMDTVRLIIALAAQRSWKIFQLDVKSAFLHGELNEDVYVEQPKEDTRRRAVNTRFTSCIRLYMA